MFVSNMRRVCPAGITGLTMPGRVWGQMRQRPRSTGPDAPAAPLPDGFPAVTFQRCATEPNLVRRVSISREPVRRLSANEPEDGLDFHQREDTMIYTMAQQLYMYEHGLTAAGQRAAGIRLGEAPVRNRGSDDAVNGAPHGRPGQSRHVG